MKRIIYCAVALLMAMACGQNKTDKVLVLYYSQTGTTETVAELFKDYLDADMEQVLPVAAYDGTYGETIARGREEMTSGNYPELQPLKVNLKDYDVVFVGFPVWFGTYANPIETLLNTVDFNGKKVVPFCTFGSGGLDSSSKAIAKKLTGAQVLPGYGVRAARIESAAAEVERFLLENGYKEGEAMVLEPFSETAAVTEEQSAIFDAAVKDYAMISAKAEEVAFRPVPEGMEYLFTARDLPRNPEFQGEAKTMKVYVLVENGKDPVFTQVCR